MNKRFHVKLSAPVLVMGYDWERYGKWKDDEQNEKDRADSKAGILAIIKAHKEFQAPLTLFVLGKLLEVEGLRELAINIVKKNPIDFIDCEQHTYSHILLKNSQQRGKGERTDKIEKDIRMGKVLVEELTERPILGLGSAQSFYRGLLDVPEIQTTLFKCGIRFIRSDGRGPNDKRPAPSYDEDGNYRGPYFYPDTPGLLEIPAHGNSDNYLKGYSKEKPDKQWSIEWELENHLEFFRVAIEKRSHFAPLNYEWSIARSDPKAEVIRGLLSKAYDWGIQVINFRHLYDRVYTL